MSDESMVVPPGWTLTQLCEPWTEVEDGKPRSITTSVVLADGRVFANEYRLPTTVEEVERICLGLRRCLLKQCAIDA